MPRSLISVVIPTCQQCASLRRALSALAGQTEPADRYEVIVSIDGSNDGSSEMIRTFRAPYALRSVFRENSGRATACSAGIRVARGDLIVLLDDDMEPAPTFLAEHRRRHSEGSRLGVMGAVPIQIDEEQGTPLLRYVGGRFNRHLEALAQPDHRLDLRDFYSGNFSIRRQLLIDLGMFDEEFRIYGNEDLELWVRLRRAGVELVYNAGAVARQRYSKDFRRFARDHHCDGQTSVLLARKHPETIAELNVGRMRAELAEVAHGPDCAASTGASSSGVPEAVVALVRWREHSGSPRMSKYYYLASDYFYYF